MAGDTPTDPAALFREMLGHWEAMANDWGSQVLKTGEFARVMHGANAATMRAREVRDDMMTRALDAAQMPSKADIADLSARIAKLEEATARIEEMLRAGFAAQGAPVAPAAPPRPKPKRTRKPPSKAKAG